MQDDISMIRAKERGHTNAVWFDDYHLAVDLSEPFIFPHGTSAILGIQIYIVSQRLHPLLPPWCYVAPGHLSRSHLPCSSFARSAGIPLRNLTLLNFVGSLCGHLVNWNTDFNKADSLLGSFSVPIKLIDRASLKLTITSIHRPNTHADCPAFIDEIKSIQASCVGPCGDFNVTIFTTERKTCNGNHQDMAAFHRLIGDLQRVDIPIVGRSSDPSPGP